MDRQYFCCARPLGHSNYHLEKSKLTNLGAKLGINLKLGISLCVWLYIYVSREQIWDCSDPDYLYFFYKNVFRLELQAMCMCIHSIYAQVLMERGALSLCSIASKRTLDSDHPLLRIYIICFMLVMKEKWGRGEGAGREGRSRQGEGEGGRHLFHPEMRTEILVTIYYIITNTRHFLKTDSRHQITTKASVEL